MAPKVVSLALAGRKLNAPPEGYGARQEQQIRTWRKTLDLNSSFEVTPQQDVEDLKVGQGGTPCTGGTYGGGRGSRAGSTEGISYSFAGGKGEYPAPEQPGPTPMRQVDCLLTPHHFPTFSPRTSTRSWRSCTERST